MTDRINMLEAVRKRLDERRPHLLNLTRRLVECESPSGDEEGSRGVVDLLIEAAQDISSLRAIDRIAVPGYGEHVRFSFSNAEESGVPQRPALILGHTDTVHPRGTVRAFPWREEGGEKIYGPGIFDMKANCALALETIRAGADLGLGAPGGRVVVLFTCDEETGSENGRVLVEDEARRASRILVLEPSAPGGRVKTGRKGTGGWTLRAHGRAAHAGLDPEKGASAVLEIARQIERVHALNDFPRGTTVNVGVVRGGTASNVIAAEAEAEIDVRYAVAEEAERLTESFRRLIPFDERVRLEISGGINRPPLERTSAVVELFAEARRTAAALGFELDETQVGGASDGNFAAPFCPAVLDGLGIEGDGAHATHEHISTLNIARRGAMLAGLLMSNSA